MLPVPGGGWVGLDRPQRFLPGVKGGLGGFGSPPVAFQQGGSQGIASLLGEQMGRNVSACWTLGRPR